jgi:hypothetical protein
MNKHINIYKPNRLNYDGMKKTERDSMPREVAIEMLCQQKLSNRERKVCMAALHTYHESEQQRKPVDQKVASKLTKATLAQLGKWLKRAIARRADTQRAYLLLARRAQKFSDEEKRPHLLATQHAMQVLDGKAAMLDTFREAVENEVTRRKVVSIPREQVLT